MSADLMEALARRTEAAHVNIATLTARLARMKPVEVGQRVAFKFCGGEVTQHGFVVELSRRPADEVLGAWVRIIGYPDWVHFEPLENLRAVCGVCQDCLRLNDRPGCLDEQRRVQP